MNATIPVLLASTVATAFAPRSAAQEPVPPNVGSRRPVDVSAEGLAEAARRAPGGDERSGFLGLSLGPATGMDGDCVSSIEDQATGECLNASSTPTYGRLLPYPGIGNVFVPPAFVGGGQANQAGHPFSTIAGGIVNGTEGDYATVGGGLGNVAGWKCVVGGGQYNRATGVWSTVAGGRSNTASGAYATVGGGGGNPFPLFAFDNKALGDGATVAGGIANIASGAGATVGGGYRNTAAGAYATIPGGDRNVAQANNTFAAGRRAQANHNGAFVWGDTQNVDKTSSGPDQFSVYCRGGARFFSNPTFTTGVLLAPGGSTWTMVSDRDAKKNVEPVDARAVLDKVAELPVATWSYEAQDDSIRHMGPMAQDFYAAFGLGLGDRTIDTIDPNGVALAAIQGLNELVQEKDAEIEGLRVANADLRRRVERLEALAEGR